MNVEDKLIKILIHTLTSGRKMVGRCIIQSREAFVSEYQRLFCVGAFAFA